MTGEKRVVLSAAGLDLSMTEVERTAGDPTNPYDWWINFRVEVQAETWTGVLHSSLLHAEIRKLAEDLESASRSLGEEVMIELAPIERGLCLTLHLNERGQISGTFSFSDTSHGPDAPRLEGAFGADQTYLLPLASQLRVLLAG